MTSDDDVWLENDNELASREINKLASQHKTSGYLMGLDIGTSQVLQTAFDDAYKEAYQIGFEIGELKGCIEALQESEPLAFSKEYDCLNSISKDIKTVLENKQCLITLKEIRIALDIFLEVELRSIKKLKTTRYEKEPKMLLEICVENVASALIAEQNGAGRIELCENLLQGGTTPSYGTIQLAKERLSIPFHVMIRPRGGDFLYSELEFEIMRKDVQIAKELGANGIVLGLLQSNGRIDVDKTKILVDLALPMSVTFHRAFDMARDPMEALEDIISIGGIQRILTSGQECSVLEGLPCIKRLVENARSRIKILPGCGIHSGNIDRILNEIDVNELHMAVPRSESSKMEYRNNKVYMGTSITTPEYELTLCDGLAIKALSERNK